MRVLFMRLQARKAVSVSTLAFHPVTACEQVHHSLAIRAPLIALHIRELLELLLLLSISSVLLSFLTC